MDELRLRRMDWYDVLALDDPPDSESVRGDLDDRAADQEQSRWERDATKDW
jgi:hypothetical protein